MAEIAPSARRVPYSRIRELAELAMSRPDVLRLYFGESNLPTPEYIKRAAFKAMADGYTFYTENAGLPSLRRGLAEHYQRLHGVSLDPLSVEEIRRFVDADTLGYRSLAGLREAVADRQSCQYCYACYTGDYPTELVNLEELTQAKNRRG
jgi:hypothetical protein